MHCFIDDSGFNYKCFIDMYSQCWLNMYSKFGAASELKVMFPASGISPKVVFLLTIPVQFLLLQFLYARLKNGTYSVTSIIQSPRDQTVLFELLRL